MRITTLLGSLLLFNTAVQASFFYVSQEEPIAAALPLKALTRKASTFSCGVSRTQGINSYSSTGSRVPFLEQYGTANIADIYNGLTPRSGGFSERYFSTTGSQSLVNMTDAEDTPYTRANALLRFTDSYNSYSFNSYHLAFSHYLFSGLYFRVHAQLTDQVLFQKASASGPDADSTRVQSFISYIDQFLGENSLPALSYSHRQLSLERLGYCLGWIGEAPLKESMFQEVSGGLLACYTFAPTHFDHPLAPEFLLHAVTHSYTGQAHLGVQINNHLAANTTASATIYERYKDSMHVVRDDLNSTTFFAGPPLLGKGIVMKNPGTLWVFEASVSANRFYGLYCTGGYHFSYQEATQLTLQDTTILRGSSWSGTPLSNLPGQQNARLNADPRLQNWKNHAVFIKAGFSPSKEHHLIPEIEFGIYFPVLGHRSVAPSRVYTGNGQLSIRWTF